MLINIDNSNNRRYTIFTDSKSSIQKINNLNNDHPIVSSIQSWLIRLNKKHKSIHICWVPSHINLTGNEQADKMAKEAAVSDQNCACEKYPYKDYYPIIKKSIKELWNNNWSNTVNNKLRRIKDTINLWPSSSHKSRKIEVMLTRLRIGHTRITHRHLMEQRPIPYCMDCLVPLTVEHILIECPEYNTQRTQCFGHIPNLDLSKIIGEKPQRVVNIESIFDFLVKVDILNKI